RNAARYARGNNPERPLTLEILLRWRKGLEILVEDNGVGLASTRSNGGGSGQGLALHTTMLAVIGGSLVTESSPGLYTRVILSLPQALSEEQARLQPTQAEG
ncbi:MAG TPA: ATP-binding protein, partial [Chloroflexia bacterium]|nr:ATP-binding protein [Chloroflexia bacterium]